MRCNYTGHEGNCKTLFSWSRLARGRKKQVKLVTDNTFKRQRFLMLITLTWAIKSNLKWGPVEQEGKEPNAMWNELEKAHYKNVQILGILNVLGTDDLNNEKSQQMFLITH